MKIVIIDYNGDLMKRLLSILIIICLLFTLYRPTQSVFSSQQLMNKIIVLDPGHGGFDNGAIINGVNEDNLNLKISFALKEALESAGATVYLTRNDDQDMTKRDYLYSKDDDMYLRVLQIDDYQPDLFLSIHLNSANPSAWGSQVFYYKNSDEGKKLARIIHESMKEVTKSQKDISECCFYVLRATQSLGVLIECGFLSNSNERGQLMNRFYHKKLADSITKGIIHYFEGKGQI